MNQTRLSIVIVNYNVRYFLEQCLQSVYRAAEGINTEIFVVDNQSVDGSCAMVRKTFPGVILIENQENTGFSKANNQAIRLARGEYILILNPDTVVQEDTFRKTLGFMDQHPEAGALGVKMIDGKGHFLPESKRALPTPWVSFYKIFGFSSLFPKSARFGRYHLGHLDKDKIHEIDVLPGAFMLMRKTVLDRIGLLDESFFMYGEDIDLSYRVTLAGFRNYYYPETAIIHYKGESTKKGSINYVLVFYQAMMIFATKHFSASNAKWYTMVIRLAIYFRAALSLVNRFVNKTLLPLMDALVLFSGFLLINPWWEQYKFPDGGGHPPEFLRIFVPAYIATWLLSIYYAGGYDRPLHLSKYLKGLLAGTAIILVLYSLLPESYRFSRALILLGSLWGAVIPLIVRWLLHLTKWPVFRLYRSQRKRVVIVGSKQESKRVEWLLQQSDQYLNLLGRVRILQDDQEAADTIGHIDQMHDIIRINKINEIIFCSRDLPTSDIIRHMLALTPLQVDYKIAPDEAEAIIGSNSANSPGDLYRIPVNSVGEPGNLRIKRILDLALALILLVISPVLVWFLTSRPLRLYSNILLVIIGKRTWVGFSPQGLITGHELPPLRRGVVYPVVPDNVTTRSSDQWLRINLDYARDYSVMKDLKILIKSLPRLNA